MIIFLGMRLWRQLPFVLLRLISLDKEEVLIKWSIPFLLLEVYISAAYCNKAEGEQEHSERL
jgi:hypothetical protein